MVKRYVPGLVGTNRIQYVLPSDESQKPSAWVVSFVGPINRPVSRTVVHGESDLAGGIRTVISAWSCVLTGLRLSRNEGRWASNRVGKKSRRAMNFKQQNG